jgi:ureidoglycolate hydrolase
MPRRQDESKYTTWVSESMAARPNSPVDSLVYYQPSFTPPAPAMETTMDYVHPLKPEPMTDTSFAAFGELWQAQDRPSDTRILAATDYQHDGQSTVGVIWQPQGSLQFTQLERHFGVTQSFVQLSGAPAVVCAAPPTDLDDPLAIPEPADVRAFLIDPGIGYSFKRGTWHSLNRHILKPPGATFIILNSSPNPTQLVDYHSGTASMSTDLDVDPSPTALQYSFESRVMFEIRP